MSMMVMCYASDITGYDIKTSELSNVALHITQDANSTEK